MLSLRTEHSVQKPSEVQQAVQVPMPPDPDSLGIREPKLSGAETFMSTPTTRSLEAQEQFRLRQLRREANIKAGQVVIVADPIKQHSSTSYAQAIAASTSTTPAAGSTAAPASKAAATPAAVPLPQ